MRIQITFKSGAQVETDVDSFTVGRNPASGELRGLEWNTPADWRGKLHWVDLSEVACVAAVREEV